jgi:hypothetical protein
MSQMFVQITAPGPGTPTVPRAFTVTGGISMQFSPGHGPLVSKSVSVQFGAGGPVQTATFSTPTNWSCTGAPAASVPPGATITLTVTARGSVRFFHVTGEPDLEDVGAVATLAVHIANPPPVVTIDAFPPEVNATALPFAFTLSGSTSDPDNNVSAVSCALDTGAFVPVDNPAGNWSRWQKSFALSGGLHRLIVQANDLGGNQVQAQAFLTVHPPIEPPDPGTESITSWTRLEPACRDADMGRSIGARLFDPLWMLARQWQMGEFQAVDVGTPVQARLRGTSALLSRCHLGVLPANTNAQAPAYDPRRMPLEAMVERRPMRAIDANDPSMLPLAVEAGLHFLRLLEELAPSRSYRTALIGKFALQALPASIDAADEATQRFAQTMLGRALDARRLATALRTAGGAAALAQDPSLGVAQPDRAKLQQAAAAWLAWYDGLFAEPAGAADDAWDPQRLEYAVSVSASFSAQPLDQVNFTASEIDDGRLDWSSFDCDFEVNMVSNNDHAFSAIIETVVPAPVSFRGAPAVRFWEIEDSQLAYGLLPVGPTDLAQMMMIEYTGSYGNDWFVMPLELPVGSINRVDSLVVTDSFGVRSLLSPIGAPGMPAANFSLWQHSLIRRAGSDIGQVIQRNLFFVPPAIGQVIDSSALEEVLFMRDEMASMAWAIERSIESPLERPFAYAAVASIADNGEVAPAGAPPRYFLSSTVPANWIPLLPVQQQLGGRVIQRLRRGAVLQPDGSTKVHSARSRTLATKSPLLLYDEEVPREGVQLTRMRRVARWIDGSSWAWTALRTQIGLGEGSSGLQFDQLAGQNSAQV